MAKKFKLSKEEIKPLVKGLGGCIASDEITVRGKKVGYMERNEPLNEKDSGWCFFAGTESDEFVNEPDNFGIYEVNTIANYDKEIIPFLASPNGSCFIRSEDGKPAFVPIPRLENEDNDEEHDV